MTLKAGDRVRMTEALKEAMVTSSADHIAEFGECVGIVQGLTDYNNCQPGEPGYDTAKVGPEVDVRWQPTNLRYAYDPDGLELVS